MALRTKCILAPIEPEDGYRISVMNRHTLNDGVSPDLRITTELYTEHVQKLAPSSKLVGDYYKRGLSWELYAERFRKEILDGKMDEIRSLTAKAQKGNITILCIEDTPEFCHRRLIAEICREIDPTLEIIVK